MENNYKEIFEILLDEDKCKKFCIYLNQEMTNERYRICQPYWKDKLDWFFNYSMACDISYSYRMNTVGEKISIIIEHLCYLRPANDLAIKRLLSINCVHGNYTGVISEEITEYISKFIYI